jgi:hypothetical protein
MTLLFYPLLSWPIQGAGQQSFVKNMEVAVRAKYSNDEIKDGVKLERTGQE